MVPRLYPVSKCDLTCSYLFTSLHSEHTVSSERICESGNKLQESWDMIWTEVINQENCDSHSETWTVVQQTSWSKVQQNHNISPSTHMWAYSKTSFLLCVLKWRKVIFRTSWPYHNPIQKFPSVAWKLPSFFPHDPHKSTLLIWGLTSESLCCMWIYI